MDIVRHTSLHVDGRWTRIHEGKELGVWQFLSPRGNDAYVFQSHTLKLQQQQLVRIAECVQHFGELWK